MRRAVLVAGVVLVGVGVYLTVAPPLPDYAGSLGLTRNDCDSAITQAFSDASLATEWPTESQICTNPARWHLFWGAIALALGAALFTAGVWKNRVGRWIVRRHSPLLAAIAIVAVLGLSLVAIRRGDGYEPTDDELQVVIKGPGQAISDSTWACIIDELTDEWSPKDKRAIVAQLGDYDFSVTPNRIADANKRCGVPGS